jgi:hypothetical protein
VKLSPEQRVEELDFLRNPDQWPNWPLLPIKRYGAPGDPPECALLDSIGAPEPKVRVVFVNMFQLRELTHAERQALRVEVYDSAEALLDDGWMVD